MPDKLDQLYDALKADGAVSKSRENFRSYMLAPGDEGYQNRNSLFKALKADGAIQSGTYEEFRNNLGIGAVKPGRSKARQQVAGQLRAAKPQPTESTNVPIARRPEGWGGTASAPTMPWENPEEVQKRREESYGWTDTLAGHAKKNQDTLAHKAVQGNAGANKVIGTDRTMQQYKDRLDYYNATGEELKNPLDTRTSAEVEEQEMNGVTTINDLMAPTVERDEQGNMVMGADGRPLIGTTTDENRVATQRMERKRLSLEDQKRQAEEELLRLREEMSKIDTDYNPYADALSPFADPRTTNGELASLSQAYDQTRERIKGLEVELAGGQHGFLNGMLSAATDKSTWLLGLDKMDDTLNMLRVSEKVKSGQELTDAEKQMLGATLANQEVQGRLDEDSDWMYRTGRMTAEMVPFMAQIFATGGYGGVAAVGTKAGQSMAQKLVARYGTDTLLKRFAANVLKATGTAFGDVAAGFASANTTGLGNTVNDALERRIGDLQLGENGEYNFVNDEDWFRAIMKAEVSQTKEFATERFGEHLPNLRQMNVWFAKSGATARKIARALSGAAGTNVMQKTAAFLRKGGINGVGGEIIEEEIGLPIDVAIGDMTWEEALSKENQWDIIGGMLLSMGAMHATGAVAQGTAKGVDKVYNTAQYYKYKRRADKAGAGAAAVIGNRWGEMRDQIDGTSNEDMNSLWETVRDDQTMSNAQKRAVFNYMNALTVMRGYNMGSLVAAKEKIDEARETNAPDVTAVETPAEADEVNRMAAEDAGYNLATAEEKRDAKNMMDLQRQRVEEMSDAQMTQNLDTDPIGTLRWIRENYGSEEGGLLERAVDYVNAASTYRGMIERVRDDIDAAVEQSGREIDEMTNENGTIIPITMKDDRQAHVISGNVVMFEDGSGIDKAKSDESIIIRDANGKLEMVAPDDILSMGDVQNAQQVKQEEAERIAEEMTEQAGNEIDGTLTFNAGDVYQLEYDGQPHQVEIVQDNGDQTVSVRIDGSQEAVPMAKEQLQQMYDQQQQARVANMVAENNEADEAAAEPQPAENETQQEEAQETQAQEQQTQPAQAQQGGIPVNEQGEPQYEQASPDVTYDTLVGQIGADATAEVARQTISEAQARLKELDSRPIEGATVQEKVASAQAIQQEKAAAQNTIDYWSNVLGVPAVREQALQEAAAQAEEPVVAQQNTEQALEQPIEQPVAVEEVQPVGASEEEQPVEETQPVEATEEATPVEAETETNEEAEAAAKPWGAKEEKRRQKLRERAKKWVKGSSVKVRLIETLDDIPNARAAEAISKGMVVKGWFEPETGEAFIYLPLIENERDFDKTYVHEVVSHKGMRALLGKEGYDELCDRVFDAMSEEEQLTWMNYPGVNTLTGAERRRGAADEYIAHLAENTNVNPSLWNKFVEWLKDAIRNIKGVELDATTKEITDLLRDSFQNMANEVEQAAEDLEERGAAVDTEKGDVRYAVADVLKGDERKKVIAELMAVTGRSEKTVKKYLQAEESLARVILDGDNVAFLDLQVDESVPSIWNNSDYPQGTVEFSNICRKRLPFTMIYQRLQQEFPNRVFDASTLEDIRRIMKENGADVACGLCFVEDRRQLLGEIGQSFIDAIQGKGEKVNDKQQEALQRLLDSGDSHIPTLYDLLTLDGMKKLRKSHPAVAQAFVEYNNARGMQAGRLFNAYSAYHREILKWNKAKVKSVNDAGGLRIFSFSDFEAHHLIDLVQVLTDCAAKGIKVQGYTKVPEFAKSIKDTKMKLNRSLIAKARGIVDADYVPQEGEAVSPNVINGKRLLLDTVEGINVNHPDFFDSTDNKNVGNILVGINDEQIRMAMLDPFVDYIIPFHSGLSAEIREKKGIGDWVNYKLSQLEKKENADGKLVNADKHGINIYTDVIPKAEQLIGHPIRNAKDFQLAFFAACNEKGWVPRFAQFINTNKKGEYVYTPGYEKLLIDFKLFDKNGKYAPQEVVQPIFDNEFNAKILNDYVKDEKEKLPIDDLYNKVKEGLGLRFRATPNEDAEYMEAVNNGDIKKAQRMVKEAAGRAMPNTKVVDDDENPMVVYHGTDLNAVNGGEPFYHFYEDSHFGTFQQAENVMYGSPMVGARARNPKLYEVYLNITNPKRVEDVPKDWGDTHSEYWEPIIRQAKEEGYDGIVYENKWEGEGDSYIAFRPEQIKSALPVNRDDEGNVIPLSERFNDENNDIRFSLGVPYQGSKSRIAERIVDALPDGERFVDLFSGGGAMTHAAMLSGKYDQYRMNDINPVGQELFLQGLRGEWRDYDKTDMTEEEFNKIKGTPEGLLWSFNGLGMNLAKDGGVKAGQQVRRVQRLEMLKPWENDIEASGTDYRDVEIRPGDVVYADIPYEKTNQTAYRNGTFNKKEFVDWAQAQDFPVYVSEYTMPDGWAEVESFDVPGMRGGKRTEKLFVQDKFAGDDNTDRKNVQFNIIRQANPRDNDLSEHTWINDVSDIKTFDEAFEGYDINEDLTPDYTSAMVKEAKKTGKVKVYSSKEIADGAFVTPSKMEAQNYAGEGKVYSKTVPVGDIAWIDPLQGQYAKADGDIRFALGGEIGASNSPELQRNLDIAKEMEKGGKDAKAIWLATGWEKGNDGKWRYEIPDAKAKEVDPTKAKSIEDIVDAPELFATYPQLKDYEVKFEKMKGAGSFNHAKKIIRLDADYNLDYVVPEASKEEMKRLEDNFFYNSYPSAARLWNYSKKLRKLYGKPVISEEGLRTIVHELQHAIQSIEGFARGGNETNEADIYMRDRAEDEATYIFATKLAAYNTEKALVKLGRTKMIGMLERGMDGFTEDVKPGAAELIDKLRDMTDSEYAAYVKRVKRSVANAKKAGSRNYSNLSGEVEARNVEARTKMSEEERRNTPPSETESVGRGEQIVRFRVENENQEVFVSNALRAVDGIKQEKATGEQWLAMLQKNGGLKAGEDKWLGLSEWLNQRKTAGHGGSITKQEVEDFIRENQIRIEEVKYSEHDEDAIRRLDELNEEFDKLEDGYKKKKAAVEEEVQAINDEMFEKYGEGWASNLDRLSEEDRERVDDVDWRYEDFADPADKAWRDLVEEYGEDFELGFELNGGSIEAIVDWSGYPADYAKWFLGSANTINDTRLNYTTEGLDNKREIALTVPTIDSYNEDDDIHFGDAGGGRAVAWIRFGETTDTDGKNVLVIDEIQSKRHQDGREKGYKDYKAYKNWVDYRKHLSEKYPNGWNPSVMTEEEMEKLESLRAEAYDKGRDLIPDAPFEKNWHELAMKRMLRLAAEEGYDKVAWTKGEQQAERYSLRKVIPSITRQDTKGAAKKGVRVFAMDINGEHEKFFVNNDGVIVTTTMFVSDADGKRLSDFFGKEMAVRMMAMNDGETIDTSKEKIGGEGMKGFYDEILPRFMNKYGKKWGVKVGEVELPNVEKAGREMWSVDVTPEMKESVMQGQVMFRVSGELDEQYPTWLSGQTTSTGQHTTQITSTVKTYRRIGDWMEKEGMKDAKVLDASSGLGTGTQALREMGFDVDDVEPYPSKDREAPTFTKYDDINGTYDVVISNAVLNVIPDDWRRDVLHSMADKVKEGGKLIINVRDAKSIENQKQKIELDSPSEILVTDSKGNIRAYQKGFTRPELKKYVEDELGEGWQVDIANESNSGIKSGTAVVATRTSGAQYREGAAETQQQARQESESARQSREAYARRQWRRAKETAEEWTSKLGLDAITDVYDTIDDVPGNKNFSKKKRRAKGWYDTKTGRIVIVMDNHRSPEDVLQTILHEGVAHYGLRQLFGDRLDTFLDNVYRNATADVRSRINATLGRNGWDHLKATEEYLARLAENTDFERAMQSGWWGKIKRAFLDMLRELGLRNGGREDIISDNELRYILWRSYENLAEPGRYRNPFKAAENTAMEVALNVGNNAAPAIPADEDSQLDAIAAELGISRNMTNRHAEEGIKGRVSRMGLRDAQEMYSRLNSLMLDDDMLDIDEHLDKVKADWMHEHGREGVGKAMANALDDVSNKYGSGMVTLRWELLDRIEELGGNDPDNNPGGLRFRVDEEESEDEDYDAGQMTFAETVTNGLLNLAEKNRENVQLRTDAMRSIGGHLGKLRQAMARQREYDKGTVDRIVRLAKMVMQNGHFDKFSKYEVNRLMSLIKNAAGKEDITKQATAVVDLLMNHQLKEMKAILTSLMKQKTSKVNDSGVEVQAGLDVDGARMVNAFKKAIKLSREALTELMGNTTDRMASSDEAVADNATVEYMGLQLAQQYFDEIKGSEDEEKLLKEELKTAKEDYDAGRMTREAYKQFEKATQDAIRENRLERTEAYERMIRSFGDGIRESVERAKEYREQEQARVNEIHHNANSDLQGVPTDEHRQLSWEQKVANWPLVRFFMKPLATFDEMLRFFGSKSVDGKGYLWNRFMGGWTDANDKEWRNVKAAHEELDAKVSEVMGRKMRWSDLFSMERKMETIPVEFWDGGEMKDHELTQGNLLYIYMVNKMADGRMKLRKMGITEEDVEYITDHIDPRFKELADWLQDDFLVRKRNEYNAVHERMFGASMAAIENYFPLKINSRSRGQEEEIGEATYNETKPSTITGSIIKRKRNAIALDVTGADAFDVVLEHIQQMEHWAAFAELNRDMNTLLSYKRFQNRVKNMSSARFGAGETLWKNFKDCCALAAGVYQPMANRNSLDTSIVNIAKGVTAAKIAFRIFTAMKQLLSYPAYFSEASVAELAKSTNPVGAAKAWNWAMQNLPGYSKRWQSRQAGDTRLKETDVDWQYWKNKILETAGRLGMTPNAFVDALTVAMGAKAIYETKYKRYVKAGYSEEDANKKALQDASIAYNETQQSSEGAFTSAMQSDRTVASVALTVFRNASMAYERRLLRALANLKKKMKRGYKEESIEYMTKQMVREGLDENIARASAERAYNRSWIEDIANTAIFGFVMQFAWNLGPYMAYLLAGDDDDEKSDMWADAALHALAGGLEGLSGGAQMSEILNLYRQFITEDDKKDAAALKRKLKDYDFNLLPLMSDLQQVMGKVLTGENGAFNDVVNLVIQSGIGVNPQTITDAAVAIVDACDGDPETSREAAFLLMRIMQVPQSAIDKLFIDEIGMSAGDAKKLDAGELARRYARYKFNKAAPLTNGFYSDAERKEMEEKYVKRFENMLKERLSKLDNEDLESSFDSDDDTVRKYAGKEAAKRMGSQDYYGSSTSEYGLIYQRIRTFDDLNEDVQLQIEQRRAKEDGDEDREKEIKSMRNYLTSIKKELVGGNEKEVMEELRRERKKMLREARELRAERRRRD